ncbi:MAG: hypothetical protein KIH64_010315, partial [Mycobacterium sp.]|nr:hypothetical protein [Mycobacterium sp.]
MENGTYTSSCCGCCRCVGIGKRWTATHARASGRDPVVASDDIETGLTERAWRDPEFASLLTREPAAALAMIGVELPAGVRVDVRIQEPNTLYYLIPPAVDPACESELGVVNQMDLWRSGDIFCWVIPE